jgi:hypothetical protein
VGVVEDKFSVSAELIDRCTTSFALEESDNFTIGCGQHGCTRRSRYVDRVVSSAFRTGLRKRIKELFRTDARNGNYQI